MCCHLEKVIEYKSLLVLIATTQMISQQVVNQTHRMHGVRDNDHIECS